MTYKYPREIQVTFLVLAVDLPLNICSQLKALELKQSMLENMTMYIEGECTVEGIS